MKYFYTGIRVRNLERSIQFYRKVMGMRVTRRGRMRHGGEWVELKARTWPSGPESTWYPTESKFFTRYPRGGDRAHLVSGGRDATRPFRKTFANGAHPEVDP